MEREAGGNSKAAKVAAREEEMPVRRRNDGEWWKGAKLPRCFGRVSALYINI